MRYHVKPYEGPNRCCIGAHGVHDEAGMIVAKCDNRTVEQADQHGNRKQAEAIAQALNEREALLTVAWMARRTSEWLLRERLIGQPHDLTDALADFARVADGSDWQDAREQFVSLHNDLATAIEQCNKLADIVQAVQQALQPRTGESTLDCAKRVAAERQKLVDESDNWQRAHQAEHAVAENLRLERDTLLRCVGHWTADGKPVECGATLYLCPNDDATREPMKLKVADVCRTCWYATPEDAAAAARRLKEAQP